jgi:NitT/TauT family transport system permease protein
MMDVGNEDRLEFLKGRVIGDHLRQGRWMRLSTLAARVLIVASLLTVWETASGRLLDPFFFSSPSAIVRLTIQWIHSGTLWFHLQFTLLELSLGYLLGSVTALASAFVLGLLFFFYEIVEPFILVAYSIPAIALGPLLIMWLGIELLPKVLLTAFFVFFIIFMNTVRAIRNVDPGLVNMAKTVGAGRRMIIFKIILPAIWPYVLTSFALAVPDAVIGAVVGEFIASYRGIAFLIALSSAKYQTAGVFSALIVLAMVVVILNYGVSFLMRLLARRTVGMG